jgi:hypothetical protein
MPSAWDFVMRQRRAGYVRIHLEDGKGIPGGIYARHSFGSTNPRQTELYLEELWQLEEDGNFEQPLPGSRGVWIAREAIGYLAFLEGEDTPYDEEDRIEAGDVGSHGRDGHWKSTTKSGHWRVTPAESGEVVPQTGSKGVQSIGEAKPYPPRPMPKKGGENR